MLEYIPTTHQFVCVVNKKIPAPKLLNALGHMTAGLVNQFESKILFTDFTQTMVPGNYVDQQNEFDNTSEQDLEYFGVCFFEEKEKSRELTKKFSLYTG